MRTLLPTLLLTLSCCLLLAPSTVRAGDFVFTPVDVSQGLSDNQIRYILQVPDGRMVFTTSGSVNLYDGTRFTYLHRAAEHLYPLSGYKGFYHIYLSGDSLLWIKDWSKLMCVDLRQEKYKTNLDIYFQHKGVKDTILDFFMDATNRMWLLTPKGLLQPESSQFLDVSLHKGTLQDLMSEGPHLYLFYSTGAVICYDLRNGKQLYESMAYPPAEIPSFERTSLVVEGHDGFYQLRNGKKGGFFHFDPQRRTWRKLLETEYGLNTLLVTPAGEAYISCTRGIWTINPKTGSQNNQPTLRTTGGDVINTEISTLFYDTQGGLWVGTLNRGLLYYHPARHKFAYISSSSFAQTTEKEITVQAFSEDKRGNIFLRSQSDYFQYLPQETHKKLKPVSSEGLPKEVQSLLNPRRNRPLFQGQSYTALCTDHRGWTWAGTSDGLMLFKPGDTKGRTFYTSDGLCNNFIHALLKDRAHRVWATTSSGISQIQVDSTEEKIQFINYNTFDGTLEGEYMNGAAFEATDGMLYFGGMDGFNILHPEKEISSPLPFKPILTALRLRGEEVKPGKEYDGRILFSETAPYIRGIELSYNQNFLTFEYSALNYLNPARTYYRYQLTGLEAHWQETTAEADGSLKISYTNLPSGKYTLKVQASNDGLSWKGSTNLLHITIHTPWWKSSLAYCVYAACLLLVIGGSIYLYLYTAKKKLERQHKEEILLLRIRNLIEQCNQYEQGQMSCLIEQASPSCETETAPSEERTHSTTDTAFLSRAMEQVERNLNVSGYSVEQLSRDLCMDRTGLYRKLNALMDQSPSLFIRNIRLQRAAQLILEGELSITEITERVGFSSSSYLSKCFQEEFGCRPSEYAEKRKKST